MRTRLLRALLAFMLVWSQQAVAVDQVPQAWTSEAVSGVYPSKAAVLGAVRARGGLYAMATDLEKVARDGNSLSVRYTYGTGPRALILGEWEYAAWTAGGWFPSEAAAVAAVMALEPCPASWTPAGDWYRLSEYAQSGVNDYEARMYTRKWAKTAEGCSRHYTSEIQFQRQRTVACPESLSWDNELKGCRRKQVFSILSRPLPCTSCNHRGNPIDVNIAEKYQQEVDLQLPGLTFARHHHSSRDVPRGRLGPGWTHSLNLRLHVFAGTGSGLLQTEDGSLIPFQSFETIDGSEWRFRSTSRGYEVSHRDLTYVFSSEILTRIEWQDGRYLDLTYDNVSRLAAAVDQSGRALRFAYEDVEFPALGKIRAVSNDYRELVSYEYDEAGRLATARYADGTSKVYHYENAAFPESLTGVTDENGVRFAIFRYDDQGRPISTEHAGGVNRGEFTYLTNGSTIHRDANGSEELISFDAQGTYRKIGKIVDGSGTSMITYAAPGSDFRTRVTERRDQLGSVTQYSYTDFSDSVLGDVRSTTIREAVGTPAARTRQEIRDRRFSNLLRVVLPDRQVDYTRNVRGQIVVTAEKDVVNGTIRTVARRYCEQSDVTSGQCPRVGLLISEDGPRDDVLDVTTYVYYPSDDQGCSLPPSRCLWRKGDLWKVVNSHGQANETLSYDDVGRPLSLRDSNGVITDFNYDPRGRLTTRAVRASN